LATTAERGAYGERVAADFLRRHGYRRHGYRRLYRNYRTERGELDLICRHGKILVFVEVRTRGTVDFGRPAETIDPAKQEALRLAAGAYLKLLGREDIYYRFDAVEVLLAEGCVPECTLIRNLFS
jgi:putative endonuclease